MQNIDLIKAKIKALYENESEIHIDVHSTRPKIKVVNAVARITGVYRNLFTIEALENGAKNYTPFNIQICLLERLK